MLVYQRVKSMRNVCHTEIPAASQRFFSAGHPWAPSRISCTLSWHQKSSNPATWSPWALIIPMTRVDSSKKLSPSYSLSPSLSLSLSLSLALSLIYLFIYLCIYVFLYLCIYVFMYLLLLLFLLLLLLLYVLCMYYVRIMYVLCMYYVCIMYVLCMYLTSSKVDQKLMKSCGAQPKSWMEWKVIKKKARQTWERGRDNDYNSNNNIQFNAVQWFVWWFFQMWWCDWWL